MSVQDEIVGSLKEQVKLLEQIIEVHKRNECMMLQRIHDLENNLQLISKEIDKYAAINESSMDDEDIDLLINGNK